MNPRHTTILLDLLDLPTAPFAESAVAEYVRRFVAARPGLSICADRWGNLLVDYARGPRGRGGPLVFAAHMDHPGFIAERMIGPRRLLARWFGGVDARLFRGAAVRFVLPGPGGRQHAVVGRIVGLTLRPRARPDGIRHAVPRADRVTLAVPQAVPAGLPGMWNFPDARVAGSRVHARGHDDIASVAAMLCLLGELTRRRVRARVTCAFTRAEETGFVGAIALARDRTLPPEATFISLETSSAAAGGVKLGDGPILRVGDRATIFDQPTSRWMELVARDLASAKSPRGLRAGAAGRDSRAASAARRFRFQRRLMPGGTCEATAFAAFGYTAAALCLPLGNYHNVRPAARASRSHSRGSARAAPNLGRLAPEVIDLADFENLVAWLLALTARAAERSRADKDLAAKLIDLFTLHRDFFAQPLADWVE